MRRYRYLLLLCMIALSGAPTIVSAHGGHTSPIQTFTQLVGPYEIAVTVEMPASTPGPLYLVVAPQGEVDQATIQIRAVPRGFPLDGAAVAEVRTYPGTRIYYSELAVDRAGDWELDLRVSGPRGDGHVRVPFTITLTPLPPETIPLAVALGGAVALVVIGLAVGAAQRRGESRALAFTQRALGYGLFACLVVAGVLGAQQLARQAQGAAATPGGRPHINVILSSEPAQPQAGEPFTLTMHLSDGSTGLPIDDLVTHHEALMHLVLIDDQSVAFAHVHPASVAAGVYQIALTLDRPGDYTAYIELERQDSGTQVIAKRLGVSGAAQAAPAPPQGLGARVIDGMEVDVSASSDVVRAGRQTTLTVSVTEEGKPVLDIEPWLGMSGHMLARSADRAILGHIHAAGAMPATTTSLAQITPPSYGPDLQFVYTFPAAGEYYLWAQFQRGGVVHTVPMLLVVADK